MRIKEVKNDLLLTTQFGDLAEALQEISVLRMAEIRDMVTKAREYEEGLIDIFADIKISSRQTRKKKEKNKLQIKKEKRVIILLSSNARFIGKITHEVYAKCIAEILNSEDDFIIVGKDAKQRYDRDGYTKKYTYFNIPDHDIRFIDILPLLSTIVQYQSIQVYYGMNINIMEQKAMVKNITGEDIAIKKEKSNIKKTFLIEPSEEALYSFFTGQILGIFFKQAIYEYELARHAARVKTLEESINHVEENKKKQKKILINLLKHEEERKQQLQNIYLYLKQNYE